MLQISRNGYLHKGEWHKVSLKFFGYSLFAREKIIKGYKGGGITEIFVIYKIFGKTIHQTLQNIRTTSLNVGFYDVQTALAKDIVANEQVDAKILNLCKGLDTKSIDTITRIISRLRTTHLCRRESYDLLTEEEYQELDRIRREFYPQIQQLSPTLYVYRGLFLPTDFFEISVLWHEHSLDELESSTLAKMKHKDIIDVGACVGDSALVFQKYTDKHIYAFEPTNENYTFLLQTIQLNNATRIIPINKALGASASKGQISVYGGSSSLIFDNHTTSHDVEIITLDSFVRERNIQVGFIKVDIEGFEQEFLKGAKQTITEQKPAMLISIYHQASDFFEIKPMIESWNLGYRFKVVKATDLSLSDEIVLFCEARE